MLQYFDDGLLCIPTRHETRCESPALFYGAVDRGLENYLYFVYLGNITKIGRKPWCVDLDEHTKGRRIITGGFKLIRKKDSRKETANYSSIFSREDYKNILEILEI